MLTTGLALASLLLQLLFARSARFGSSGPISSALSAVGILVAIAIVWLLALQVGWWTVAAFVLTSLIAGAVSPRDSLVVWHNLQPITGLAALALCLAAWATRIWA